MLHGGNSHFWAFKESHGFAGKPMMNIHEHTHTHTLLLSTFCFCLYLWEVVHKSNVL